jgi:hypothetical protein
MKEKKENSRKRREELRIQINKKVSLMRKLVNLNEGGGAVLDEKSYVIRLTQ